jgi:hypothetical protein
MSDILFIDADWDLVTQYGRAFRERFVFGNFDSEWPDYNNHTSLRGLRATQPDVDDFIKSNDVKYISGMGHGSHDTFTGYENKPIWSTNQDLTFLQGALVHLLSCQTGALLGTTMVMQGATVFWGYTVNFVFFHQTSGQANLTDDKLAEAYLKMDCIIDRGILSKKSASEIHESITTYVAQIYPQLRDPRNPLKQAAFLDNYLHLACPVIDWGDTSATL